jgi:hypothetical protein
VGPWEHVGDLCRQLLLLLLWEEAEVSALLPEVLLQLLLGDEIAV